MLEHKTERAPVGIRWSDLQPTSKRDIIRELLLPIPWLVRSFALFATSLWPIGFLASFMFFLCALRLNHEAIHGNLGLPRWADRLVMHVLSFLMGASNNAVAYGHLQHHKHARGPGDFEGHCGHKTFWEVLRYGPRFPVDVNREAWRGASPKGSTLTLIEWALNLLMIALAIWVGSFLMRHVGAIAIAQCLNALFAVWITLLGTSETGVAARSQRGVLAHVAYLMFYHREHHLYPRVPVRRLPVLAERLDRGVPGYAAERLPVFPWFDRPT